MRVAPLSDLHVNAAHLVSDLYVDVCLFVSDLHVKVCTSDLLKPFQSAFQRYPQKRDQSVYPHRSIQPFKLGGRSFLLTTPFDKQGQRKAQKLEFGGVAVRFYRQRRPPCTRWRIDSRSHLDLAASAFSRLFI